MVPVQKNVSGGNRKASTAFGAAFLPPAYFFLRQPTTASGTESTDGR